MNRILLVKTSSLGDVVHNLPVVNDIKSHYPNVDIDWLVEESFASIPKLHPNVNHVLTVATRRWRKQLLQASTWDEIALVKEQLGAEQYDLIIDTQSLVKSAWMTKYAQGKKVGFGYKTSRERLASFFYQETHEISREIHAVTRNRMLAAAAAHYTAPTDAPDYGIQSTSHSGVSLPKRFVIGLHGTSKATKLWPDDQWIALANLLAVKDVSLLLPWSDDEEKSRAEFIASATENVTVLPRSSIASLAGIINLAIGAVGVDTGLSHLSAAIGKPTVGIYLSTSPSRVGLMAEKAVNLGGIGQQPTPNEVMQTLASLGALL